jgi:acyl carrier protein
MTEQAQAMIEFIMREIVRQPGIQITEHTTLVSSGLVDSLALVDILAHLEKVTGCRIPPGQVQAEQMNTVSLMLATAERVGRRSNNYRVRCAAAGDAGGLSTTSDPKPAK